MIENAVKREVLEECGISVNVIKNIEVFHYYEEQKNIHWLCLGYLCSYLSGAIKNNEQKEVAEVKWFDINDIPSEINPNTKRAIKKYVSGL